ncbi:MAG: hypothetical protein LBV71_13145 [Prevotella sp.]|nr:hypothetical protein [Prevotella sp.]
MTEDFQLLCKIIDTPDEIIKHTSNHCVDCGGNLYEVDPVLEKSTISIACYTNHDINGKEYRQQVCNLLPVIILE